MTLKKSFETIAVSGVSGGDKETGAISFSNISVCHI